MAITPAVELADWASGIGTGPLQIDNVTDRVGIGTTAPLALLDVAMSEPTPSGSGITTALLIRHTAGSLHALRVEDESHPDVTPFIINSNGRVAIGTDNTDGNELSVVRGNPSILLKATTTNNGPVFIFEGKDNAGIACTTEINSRNTGGLDIDLDVYGTNTESENINYRKLRIRSNSQEKVVVTGIGSVGIGTSNPDAKLHILGSRNAGGIFVDNNSEQLQAPAIEVIGKRLDSNRYHSFGGKLLLAKNRTDNKTSGSSTLGTLGFGGNHTDGTMANILYAASIHGVSEDSFDSATDMPTGLSFHTGSTGQNGNTNNVEIGSERLRITSAGLIGISTVTPEHPLHIYRNDATLAVFERAGVANAGIEFKKSQGGNGGPQTMFLGLSADNTFAINNSGDLDSSPYFRINRTGIASAFAFTSSNDDATGTDGTCAINLTGTSGAIAMDTDGGLIGTKRITWNDGNGNLNIRHNNHYDDASSREEYLISNDGAVHLALNAESADGTFTVGCYDQGTAGDPLSGADHLFASNGFTISGCGRLRDNTGQYGSIEITGGSTTNYGGYSIEGAAVFMRNASSGIFGLYDDTNNHWVLQHTPNGTTQLYHDGSSKIQTTSGGVNISGELECTQLDVNGPSNFSNQGDVTFNGASAQMIWDQSASRLRLNDNASLAFGSGSDTRIYHDNVDTFMQFNDRDFYLVDASPGTNIRSAYDSSAGNWYARGQFRAGQYLNTAGQITHTTGGIISVGNNPVNNSNNLISLDPRRPTEPAGQDAILYRRSTGPEPAPTGNSAMFTVERNGDVTHAGSSPGPSDARLKTNIVDAPPQWDDIKAMRVRNYNRIDGAAGGIAPATDDIGPATDPSLIVENPKHIGLIAQELLEVSPGLVRKKWDANAWFDDDGNEVDEHHRNAKHIGVSSTSTDNWTYHVRQQPITFKMLKALQETMFKIEVLELRLNNAGIALT